MSCRASKIEGTVGSPQLRPDAALKRHEASSREPSGFGPTFQLQGATMFGIGTPVLGFIGGIGMPELLIVGFIVLILFGSRLPGVMRSLGQGVVEFKKGVQGIDEEAESSKKG
jgi:sec-independent protein translocase protein TatA